MNDKHFEVPMQHLTPMDYLLSCVKVLESHLDLDVEHFIRNIDGNGVADDVDGAHRIS